MNERYQKQNAHAGKTRKSASSAKPKREAGTYSSSPEKKAPAKKKKPTWSEMVPSTPEIKKWRRIWYVFLAIAIVGFGVAYWGQQVRSNVLSTVGFIVELVGVGVAITIDLVVIRKLRTQAIKDRDAGKKGKPAEKTAPKSDNDASAADAGKDPS